MHHVGADDIEAVSSQHVRLHGDIGDMMVFDRCARFHFDEAKAALFAASRCPLP